MAEIRGSQERQRDPVLIGEFEHRMRKVRRAWCFLFGALISAILVGSFGISVGEVAGLVIVFSMALVVVIIVIIAIYTINTNYHCPSCGEPPYSHPEGGVRLNVESCESCGAELK